MIGPGLGLGLAPGAVRRWKPSDQGGLLALWDPNVAATINTGTPNDGDLINTIADQVGGFTLTKFNDAYRPTYNTNVLNGQAAITFNGAGGTGTQSLRTATDVIPCGNWSIIEVVKANNTGSNFIHTFSNEANGYASSLFSGTAPTSRVKNSGGTSDKNLSLAWLNNNAHTLMQLNDGTHAGNLVYRDNIALALTDGASTANPGSASFNRRFLLGTSGGLSSPFTGAFLYIAIIDHSLSANERSLWQGYLKTRFPSLT